MENINIVDMTPEEEYEVTIKKCDLLLSDYTLVDTPEEKSAILGLMDNYIAKIDDEQIRFLFSRLAGTNNADEKELYTEILMDTLADRREEA